MGKIGYVNRDGARITKEAWLERRNDAEYCKVREYDNGIIYVMAEWVGSIDSIDESFEDMWKVFRLHVCNYNDMGKLVPDPVMNCNFYPTQKKINDAIDEFLVRWTESHVTEEGKFVEADNDLAPPPPPNLDAPSSDAVSVKINIDDGGIGAW